MKILVDEMPAKVEDCPWAQPVDNPWGLVQFGFVIGR